MLKSIRHKDAVDVLRRTLTATSCIFLAALRPFKETSAGFRRSRYFECFYSTLFGCISADIHQEEGDFFVSKQWLLPALFEMQ